ncbi:MAG: pyrroline-5-carboxylate reductase [Candidatus Omnitrophica bacterium]|nr:pyrroline-5-carboxylate reductase [Candidatus Omnitrophota bacterium]
MGQALIAGLLGRGVSPAAIRAAEANPDTHRRVAARFRVGVSADLSAVVRASDVVVLAVKPQQVPDVLPPLRLHVRPRQVVISIAAGITLRWLQARLPGIPVVRVMPNLPATVGCAFSAITPGRFATARHRTIALALFNAVGDTLELPERLLDAITAVSGSGPAYVFFLVQAWEEAARTLGLPPRIASRAIRQTLEGSVRLLRSSPEPATALISHVASKGGTTEAALTVLSARRVAAHFAEALKASARRSKELSWS